MTYIPYNLGTVYEYVCACGWTTTYFDNASITCYKCKAKIHLKTSEEFVYRPSLNITYSVYHKLWRQLHQSPWLHWNKIRKWYADWRKLDDMPCGNCKENWKKAERRTPPNFKSPMDFFKWGVDRHNEVNIAHGKQVFSYEAALELHKPFFNRDDSKPNIGFVSASYMKVGGTETWNRTIIPSLKRVNPTGMVVTQYYEGDPTLLHCPVKHGADAVQELIDVSDVVLSWGVANMPGDRNILIHHGDLNIDWFKWYIESQADRALCVVCINPNVAEYARNTLNCEVHYIPNAVDPARAIADEPQTLLRCVGCNTHIVLPTKYCNNGGCIVVCEFCETDTEYLNVDKPVCLWVSRYSEEKRAQIVADVAALMPDYQFVMVGDGPEVFAPTIKSNNVILRKSVDNPAKWLAVADVFLSTAYSEGFGLSMAEAMLAGVPVVATPRGLGEHKDLVNQVAVDATPQTFADSIRNLDIRKAFKAKEYIEDNHNIDKVVDQWENLILQLCS